MDQINSFKNSSDNSWIDRTTNTWNDASTPFVAITTSVVESWEYPVILSVSEPYPVLTVDPIGRFVEPYGSPIGTYWTLPYNDIPEIIVSYTEWYDDAVTPIKRFVEPYNDLWDVTATFELPWLVSEEIISFRDN